MSLLALIACSNESKPTLDVTQVYSESIEIPQNFRLNESDVAKLANDLNRTDAKTTRYRTEVSSVRPIYLDEIIYGKSSLLTRSNKPEDIIMYAAMNGDNDGFKLLSSDIRVPVLAEIEGGTFDEQLENPGVLIFLRRCLPFIDEQIENYSNKQAELNSPSPLSRAENNEYLISSSTNQTIYIESPESYPGDLVGLYPTFSVDKILKTEWHQLDPYNMFLPGGEETHPAGFMTIAAAQTSGSHRMSGQ